MNARVFSIASSIISALAAIDLAYTAIKYMRKCNRLEKELKQYKEKEAEASN